LKYENIGKYSDLDIDENLFKEFNSGFKHIEKIEESNRDYKEDTLIDYLRDILDEKNDIYLKYKDEKLTSEQFELAYKEIAEKNENIKKRKPKPTHHLMIPMSEDIEIIDGELNEQASLKLFMSDFLINMKEYTETDKSDKFYFCRDLFQEIGNCFNNSTDKIHNNELYSDRENLKKKKKKNTKE